MRTAGWVLAGGASSRMGTDKALLNVEGRALVEIAANAVREAAGSATIVGRPEAFRDLGVAAIPDLREGAGPLGGIEAVLKSSDAEWNLVVACDMPRLRTEVLRSILERGLEDEDALAVLPEVQPGFPEPLCAAYHIRCLPAITAALDRGIRKVTAGLPEQGVRTLRITDGQVFQNLNTPEEWRLAQDH